MAIRLGVAPIAWSNDDLPQLGGDTPLEVCLQEAREAGYSGVEAGGKFPMDPAILGPLLAAHDIKLVSGWFSGALREVSVEQEKQRVARQLATFKALGCPVMVYADTTDTVQNRQEIPLSRRPRLRAGEMVEFGRKVTDFAEWMSDQGMPIAYHHHMGTLIETQEELDLLMESTGPAVGLTLDSGHLTFAGGDLSATVRRHAQRIRHIHCKDIRPDVVARAKQQDLSFLDAVLAGAFTVPGDGCIDFHAFARDLADVGYAGWMVVEAEQDPAKANPLEYAKLGYRHLQSALAEAGLEIAA
jgi:inosose dehydratase